MPESKTARIECDECDEMILVSEMARHKLFDCDETY